MAISARNICSIGIAILITAFRNDFRGHLPIPYANELVTLVGILLIALSIYVHNGAVKELKEAQAAAQAKAKAKEPKSE